MPPVTKNLIIINALFFLGTLVAPKYGIDLTDIFGLHFFLSPEFKLHQLFTYMFMHGGFEHILFNMFSVWMFGRVLEQVWGPKRFLTYYLVCGVGAGLIQEAVQAVSYYSASSGMTPEMIEGVLREGAAALNQSMNFVDPSMARLNLVLNSATVGASGAIYAILLAFGMTFPNQPIYLYFLLPLKAKYFVIIFGVLEMFLGMAQTGDGVAHFAHVGGMLFGLIFILYWRKKYRYGQYYQ